jgi:ComF family protein
VPAYAALRSWAVFEGPLRNALHRLKYRGDVALGEILARQLLEKLKGLDWVVDLVAPVPLGIARQKQRGYNQSTLLALPLALGCGIAYRPQALAKVRETPSQVGLSSEERFQNVEGAFQANARIVSGKRVLVVDDVTTSGATLNACANALKEAGASKVYALTLARAV